MGIKVWREAHGRLLRLDLVFRAQAANEQGHYEQDCQNSGEHAAHDDAGQRLLGLSANPVGNGSRAEAQAGCHTGHDHRPHFVTATFFQAGFKTFLVLRPADAGKEDDRAQGGNPGERGEANRR